MTTDNKKTGTADNSGVQKELSVQRVSTDHKSSGSEKPSRRFSLMKAFGLAATGVLVVGGYAIYDELMDSSTLQSHFFPKLYNGEVFTKMVTTTPPAEGTADIEHGYAAIPHIRELATQAGDIVSPQVEWKDRQIGVLRLAPIFPRPAQSGVRIIDSRGEVTYQGVSPHDVYKKYEDIPPVLTASLCLVEDEFVCDIAGKDETYNAAVNWPRSIYAAALGIGRKFNLTSKVEGGSTLAIQVVKNNSWEKGRTKGFLDKAEQMLTASTEMYANGPDTTAKRHETVLKYMNGALFAGHPQFGEVTGWKDAMAVWFGNNNYDEILRSGKETPEAARVFRQTFSLVMSLKMPDRSLRKEAGFKDLQQRVDNYIPLLVKEKIITESFAKLVLAEKIEFADVGKNPVIPPKPPRDKFVDSLRLALMNKLELSPVDAMYTLDRWDLQVDATLDHSVNEAVTNKLKSFNDPEIAKQSGLTGFQLLRPEAAEKVTWAITINERLPDGRIVTRVSTDTFKGQLDLTKGGRQNFGSTGKMRMAATFLNEVISELHDEYADKDPETLKAITTHPKDKLTRWALDYLSKPDSDRSLDGMLRASIKEIKYSGAPQGFFTGGGMNYPGNFDRKEDRQSYSVEGALWESVNLSWYRITDDIEEYMKWHRLKIDPQIFDDTPDHPEAQAQRQKYLEEFADFEGREFQEKFWNEMRGKTGEEITAHLAGKTKGGRTQLAVIYLSLHPEASFEDFSKFMQENCKNCKPNDDQKKLYDEHRAYKQIDITSIVGVPVTSAMEAETPALVEKTDRSAEQLAALFGKLKPNASYPEMRAFIIKHATDKNRTWLDYKSLHVRYASGEIDPTARFYNFHLNDRGYLARPVHPLELVVAAQKLKNPEITWKESVAETKDERIFVYKWLLQSNKKKAQDKAIGIMLDHHAWKQIENSWHKVGYPFKLVPSLATVIGVSGDTTDALATFNSILLNQGKLVNTRRFTGLHFGVGTPHETHITPGEPVPQQVLRPEVAQLMLEMTQGVVSEHGTGWRLKKGFTMSDGNTLVVRGKTGTNDESETSGLRVGAFTGTIGDRYSFCISGYITEASPRDKFTSGIAVQALKMLTPELLPLFERSYGVKPAPVKMEDIKIPGTPDTKKPETTFKTDFKISTLNKVLPDYRMGTTAPYEIKLNGTAIQKSANPTPQ